MRHSRSLTRHYRPAIEDRSPTCPIGILSNFLHRLNFLTLWTRVVD
jgi:hypothetical protein